ncbi:MAG: tRNA glutamyl-Q(34) synthetase GluQRS [Porticoccaceae bacterium]
MPAPYIGRFAPSPTGPLHFGSLVAALASYLDARACGGRWLVRMEDIDPPREMPGAADLILRQLERHGLCWDGEVLYQGARFAIYDQVIETLLDRGLAYFCDCSRQRIQALGGRYDGRCRRRAGVAGNGCGVRLAVPEGAVMAFDDLFQGRQEQHLDRESGDFIIRRRDGLPAYQLAVTVDDAFQRVSHVVRGSDLLDSTGRQILLLEMLGEKSPVYGHIPVATNPDGCKLSKQNLAPSLDLSPPDDNLRRALAWLGVDCQGLDGLAPPALLAGAAGRWRRSAVDRCQARPAVGSLDN